MKYKMTFTATFETSDVLPNIAISGPLIIVEKEISEIFDRVMENDPNDDSVFIDLQLTKVED